MNSLTRKPQFYKPIVIAVLVIFGLSLLGPIPRSVSAQNLPVSGIVSPLNSIVMKGLKVFSDDPFRFDFVVEKGDLNFSDENFKEESLKLIKYFLASLTIPDKDLWVNLSPNEPDRIIPQEFGLTQMGRDLLAQDYLLKQITSSLMNPEGELGQKFWERIYTLAQEKYGTSDIPMDAMNKVWIVPEKAVVFVSDATAFIVEARLKVLLEEDYVRRETLDARQENDSSNILREVIIPEIEKEVNDGEGFAPVRQIYNSLILATWFKRNLQKSVLGQTYVGKNKIEGVDIEDKQAKEKIYQQYLEAFKKGAFEYIKEDYDSATQQIIPRKYFSGGVPILEVNRVYHERYDLAALAEPTLTNASHYAVIEGAGKPVEIQNDAAMLRIELKQTQSLTLVQKQELRESLKARDFGDQDIPEATLGLAGLKAANDILRERGAVGIIVGSSARALWNRASTEDDLIKRKDIDVLVLSPGFSLKKPFEGGIDWWLPRECVLKDEQGGLDIQNVYVNGNKVLFRANISLIEAQAPLEPGLYLPSREFLIELTAQVIDAQPKYRDQGLDAAFKEFLDHRWLRKGVSSVWRDHFQGVQRVLGQRMSDPLTLEVFTPEKFSMLQRFGFYYDAGPQIYGVLFERVASSPAEVYDRLDWSTTEQAILNIQTTIQRERSDLWRQYERYREDPSKFSPEQKKELKEMIYRIVEQDFVEWGLGDIFDKNLVPYFEESYVTALSRSFPALDFNPLAFRAVFTGETDEEAKSNAIKSIQAGLERFFPGFHEEYEAYVHDPVSFGSQGFEKIEGILDVLFSNFSQVISNWRLRDITKDKQDSFIQMMFPAIHDPEFIAKAYGYVDWSDEAKAIENIQTAIRKNKPELWELYKHPRKNKSTLGTYFSVITDQDFVNWGLGLVLDAERIPYFKGSFKEALAKSFSNYKFEKVESTSRETPKVRRSDQMKVLALSRFPRELWQKYLEYQRDPNQYPFLSLLELLTKIKEYFQEACTYWGIKGSAYYENEALGRHFPEFNKFILDREIRLAMEVKKLYESDEPQELEATDYWGQPELYYGYVPPGFLLPNGKNWGKRKHLSVGRRLSNLKIKKYKKDGAIYLEFWGLGRDKKADYENPKKWKKSRWRWNGERFQNETAQEVKQVGEERRRRREEREAGKTIETKILEFYANEKELYRRFEKPDLFSGGHSWLLPLPNGRSEGIDWHSAGSSRGTIIMRKRGDYLDIKLIRYVDEESSRGEYFKCVWRRFKDHAWMRGKVSWEVRGQYNGDRAMLLNNAPQVIQDTESTKGGIDFDPNKINLETRGQQIHFDLPDATELNESKISGFTPVIFNIKPLQSLPLFLGITQQTIPVS